MAQLRAIQARGLLRFLYSQTAATGQRMIDLMFAAQAAIATKSFQQGRIYVSSSGSGQSHGFLIPALYTADFTVARVAEQIEEYIEIYYDLLTGYGGNQSPIITSESNDNNNALTILLAMLGEDRLQTVTQRRLDITGIRFPGNAMQVP